MADVFISYHEQSAGELVAKIADALENVGIFCWYAKRDIPPGGNFARDIPPQIDACKVFLLILNDSVVHQSNHIENELGLAFGRLNRKEEITILPLEIGDFKRETWVKYYLVHTQSVKIPLFNNTYAQELTNQIGNILGFNKITLNGVSLRNANLHGASLRNANLRGVDLSYADLSYADLSGADLRDVNFHNANLKGTKF